MECLRSLRFYSSKQSSPPPDPNPLHSFSYGVDWGCGGGGDGTILGNALYKYDNPVDQRDQIRKDNINKSGVYG